MRYPASLIQHRGDLSAHAQRRLAVTMLTVALTGLGLVVVAAICWQARPPLDFGPSFSAQFTVLPGFFYAKQPAKTLAYEAGCVATPVLLLLSFFAARRWVDFLSIQAVRRVTWAGASLYSLLTLGCAWPMLYCPDPPFWIVPPSWLLLPVDIAPPYYVGERVFLFLLAAGLGFIFVRAPQTPGNANRVTAGLLGLWLWLIPSRFYSPGEIKDSPIYTYHLNTLLDALSQSVNGHHWLIDFPHIYGGYGELLAPFIRLFPRDLGVILTVLGLPGIIGMLCLLLAARLLVRQPGPLYFTGLSLFGLIYSTSAEDLYFGFSAARFFFPAVGLFLATLYFRRPSVWKYAVTTALAAVASIWNADTGLVIWASWLLTLLASRIASRDFTAASRDLAIQLVALAAVCAALVIGLRIASGQWPQPGYLFYFTQLVVGDGYFCLRMLVPDMWTFILLIYLAALALALAGHLRGRPTPRQSMTLMLSLLGIGLFSYFMGRSAPSNLVMVAYPAVLLAGKFWAQGELLQRRHALSPQLRFVLLPLKFALFWWVFIFSISLLNLGKAGRDAVAHWNDQTPLLADAGFIRGQVQPHEDGVFFLSNQSGVFYYLSGTTRPLKIPGMIELLRAPDMKTLLDAIRTRRIRKLFVGQDFTSIEMYRLEIYQSIHDAIAQNYQPLATSPTGQVVLYEPR